MWNSLRVGTGAATGLRCAANHLHNTLPRMLPQAAALRLPDNIQDINASEMGRFSPLRSRDISGIFITSQEHYAQHPFKIDVTLDCDPHIGPYDCRGAVSLSSSMQSNVPSPFGGQLNYLSMPGSQWGHGQKYLSEHLNNSHYLNLRNSYKNSQSVSGMIRSYHTSTKPVTILTDKISIIRTFCDKVEQTENKKPLSRKEKLKQAVAAYGSTVIIFHVTISLASLGTCYLLVSSGLDVTAWIEYFGLADTAFSKKVTANAGTFVVAYAVHKVFAPVRIGITLTATPFIVRYLRRIGILKTPKK